MKIDWDILWESVKEPLRILIFALIGWLLTVIVPQLPPAVGAIVALLLKFLDELLHQSSKVQSKAKQNTGWLGLKGLTNF